MECARCRDPGDDGLEEATVHIEADKHGAELLEQTTVEMRGSTLVVTGPRQGGIFDFAMFGGKFAGKRLNLHAPNHV